MRHPGIDRRTAAPTAIGGPAAALVLLRVAPCGPDAGTDVVLSGGIHGHVLVPSTGRELLRDPIAIGGPAALDRVLIEAAGRRHEGSPEDR